MTKIWSFLRKKNNREVLGWIGAGLAAAIAGLWTAVVYFSPPNPKTTSAGPNVEANCGSVAIGRDVSGSTITAGNTGNCPEKKP